MIVLGIDPGKRRGTGLALVAASPRRVILAADTELGDAKAIVKRARRMSDGLPLPLVFAVETMAPQGAARFNKHTLANAQFVGEIVGLLEAWGETVVQVTKREALAAIGCGKGKAPESRVRRCVEALFGSTKGMSAHAVDAVAAAWAARMKMRCQVRRSA